MTAPPPCHGVCLGHAGWASGVICATVGSDSCTRVYARLAAPYCRGHVRGGCSRMGLPFILQVVPRAAPATPALPLRHARALEQCGVPAGRRGPSRAGACVSQTRPAPRHRVVPAIHHAPEPDRAVRGVADPVAAEIAVVLEPAAESPSSSYPAGPPPIRRREARREARPRAAGGIRRRGRRVTPVADDARLDLHGGRVGTSPSEGDGVALAAGRRRDAGRAVAGPSRADPARSESRRPSRGRALFRLVSRLEAQARAAPGLNVLAATLRPVPLRVRMRARLCDRDRARRACPARPGP